MTPIASSKQENVILFPKTIEYYQKELTRMLEGERYGEAARMLRFLLQAQSEDPHYKEEWQSLLGWLSAAFPDAVREDGGEAGGDPDAEGDDSETELLKRHVRAKAAADAKFADKLLDMLSTHSPLEKQMMALEQLAHLERRTVGERLKLWVSDSRLHPLVQFRALQVLKTIGETGTIELRKLGQTIVLPIGGIPLRYEEFPERIRNVLERVREVSEADQPGLADFVESAWRDFLAFVYGTSVYEELLELDDAGRDVWAAALHHTVQETMFGSADETELQSRYGLKGDVTKSLHKAQQVLKLFETVSSPADC